MKDVALTKKQRVFVEEYLQCWNATEAARRAGYSERSIRCIASENLTKPNIAEEIARRIAEKAMSADEVLLRLADMARADMGPFVWKDEYDNLYADWDELKKAKLTHLVKSIKRTKYGTQIELHDAQVALQLIGKRHGLFMEQQKITLTTMITSDELAQAKAELDEWQKQRFGDDE